MGESKQPALRGLSCSKTRQPTSWGLLLPCAALRLEELADCLQRLLQGGVPLAAVAAARCLCLQTADHARTVHGHMHLHSLIV